MKTAKAAIFKGACKPFEIKEYPLLPPPEGYAKIKLISSGICGTDVHIYRGKLAAEPPAIIGHEFVGKVEELALCGGEASGISIGDNVIVDIACPCGECPLCLHGDDANCVNFGVTNEGNPDKAPHFWGGYAEYNYSPIKNLIKIPHELDPAVVSVYACAGATAMHAFSLAERANIVISGSKVAVVQGMGPVGSFAVAYLSRLCENVIAVVAGNNPDKKALARSLGAKKVFSLSESGEDEIEEYVSGLTGGLGADILFEGSGNPSAIVLGMKLLRNRGLYLVPGQYSSSGGIEIQPQLITFKALQIFGSSQYSICDVEAYLDFLKVNPSLYPLIRGMISAYTVDRVNEAFADILAGKNIKTVLVSE